MLRCIISHHLLQQKRTSFLLFFSVSHPKLYTVKWPSASSLGAKSLSSWTCCMHGWCGPTTISLSLQQRALGRFHSGVQCAQRCGACQLSTRSTPPGACSGGQALPRRGESGGPSGHVCWRWWALPGHPQEKAWRPTHASAHCSGPGRTHMSHTPRGHHLGPGVGLSPKKDKTDPPGGSSEGCMAQAAYLCYGMTLVPAVQALRAENRSLRHKRAQLLCEDKLRDKWKNSCGGGRQGG